MLLVFRYYHCTNGKKLHTTPLQYVTEDDLNSVVSQVLKDFKIPEDKLTELQKALNDSYENKIAFYEAKRKELIAKRKRLSNLQLDGKNLFFNLKEPFDKLMNLSKGSYGWG